MYKFAAIISTLLVFNTANAEIIAITRDNIFGEIKLYDRNCTNRNGQFASRFNQAENTRWTGCWMQVKGSIFIYWDIPKNDPGNYPRGPMFEYSIDEFVKKKN